MNDNQPPRAGAPWNGEEDKILMNAFDRFIKYHARMSERTKSSILTRVTSSKYAADLWRLWKEEKIDSGREGLES